MFENLTRSSKHSRTNTSENTLHGKLFAPVSIDDAFDRTVNLGVGGGGGAGESQIQTEATIPILMPEVPKLEEGSEGKGVEGGKGWEKEGNIGDEEVREVQGKLETGLGLTTGIQNTFSQAEKMGFGDEREDENLCLGSNTLDLYEFSGPGSSPGLPVHSNTYQTRSHTQTPKSKPNPNDHTNLHPPPNSFQRKPQPQPHPQPRLQSQASKASSSIQVLPPTPPRLPFYTASSAFSSHKSSPSSSYRSTSTSTFSSSSSSSGEHKRNKPSTSLSHASFPPSIHSHTSSASNHTRNISSTSITSTTQFGSPPPSYTPFVTPCLTPSPSGRYGFTSSSPPPFTSEVGVGYGNRNGNMDAHYGNVQYGSVNWNGYPSPNIPLSLPLPLPDLVNEVLRLRDRLNLLESGSNPNPNLNPTLNLSRGPSPSPSPSPSFSSSSGEIGRRRGRARERYASREDRSRNYHIGRCQNQESIARETGRVNRNKDIRKEKEIQAQKESDKERWDDIEKFGLGYEDILEEFHVGDTDDGLDFDADLNLDFDSNWQVNDLKIKVEEAKSAYPEEKHEEQEKKGSEMETETETEVPALLPCSVYTTEHLRPRFYSPSSSPSLFRPGPISSISTSSPQSRFRFEKSGYSRSRSRSPSPLCILSSTRTPISTPTTFLSQSAPPPTLQPQTRGRTPTPKTGCYYLLNAGGIYDITVIYPVTSLPLDMEELKEEREVIRCVLDGWNRGVVDKYGIRPTKKAYAAMIYPIPHTSQPRKRLRIALSYTPIYPFSSTSSSTSTHKPKPKPQFQTPTDPESIITDTSIYIHLPISSSTSPFSVPSHSSHAAIDWYKVKYGDREVQERHDGILEVGRLKGALGCEVFGKERVGEDENEADRDRNEDQGEDMEIIGKDGERYEDNDEEWEDEKIAIDIDTATGTDTELEEEEEEEEKEDIEGGWI